MNIFGLVICVQWFTATSLLARLQVGENQPEEKIQHSSTLADLPWGRQDGCLPKLILGRAHLETRAGQRLFTNPTLLSEEPKLQLKEGNTEMEEDRISKTFLERLGITKYFMYVSFLLCQITKRLQWIKNEIFSPTKRVTPDIKPEMTVLLNTQLKQSNNRGLTSNHNEKRIYY